MDSFEGIQEELPLCLPEQSVRLIVNGDMRLLEVPLEPPLVSWKGKRVNLTKGQYAMLRTLLQHAGINCTSKRLYECIWPPGFHVGWGEESISVNVRSMMRRIQERIRFVDDSFCEVATIPGFGYRWGAPMKPAPGSAHAQDSLHVGALDVYPAVWQVFWKGTSVPCTGSEVRVVALLASMAGRWIEYRTLYNRVWREGFISGRGGRGYFSNMRTLIKRVRRKFREVDPSFDCIENRSKCGYMWSLH